jgi:hypothetical protein
MDVKIESRRREGKWESKRKKKYVAACEKDDIKFYKRECFFLTFVLLPHWHLWVFHPILYIVLTFRNILSGVKSCTNYIIL